jgi:hypothetical protein
MKLLIPVLLVLVVSCKQKPNHDMQAGEIADTLSTTVTDSPDDDCHPTDPYEYSLILSSRPFDWYPDDFLLFMSDSALRFLRNYTYAIKGYKFKTQSLEDLFSTFSWYCPKYDDVDSLLTDLERQNIDYIKSFERKTYPDTLDKHRYFLDLFTGEGRTIPMYFWEHYLGFDNYSDVCRADTTIKQTNKYDVVIYFTHPIPIPCNGIYDMRIITIDNNGRIISSQEIFEGYRVVNQNELVSTEYIFDYSRDCDADPIAEIEYRYVIRPNGAIIRTRI